MKMAKQSLKGFKFIELLIVIAVIAILAAVVFVALDPLERFQDARDATRWSDADSILSAVKLDQVDNGGSYIAAVSGLVAGTYYMVGTCANGAAGCTAQVVNGTCADLTGLVTENYLASVPQDPSTGAAAQTDYYIMRSAGDVITVGACDPGC